MRLTNTCLVRWFQHVQIQPARLQYAGTAALPVCSVVCSCLHIHHQNYTHLGDLLLRQLHYAVTDAYDTNPESFSFDEYVSKAYQTYSARHDTKSDGDLSHVLATIMAWDALIRGLLHWEQCSPRPKMKPFFSIPVTATVREELQAELDACLKLAKQEKNVNQDAADAANRERRQERNQELDDCRNQ